MNWALVQVLGHLLAVASTPILWMCAFAACLLRADKARHQWPWIIGAVIIALWMAFLYTGTVAGADLCETARHG